LPSARIIQSIKQAFDLVVKKSPIPWLHIAEEVAAEAKRQNYKCLGVLDAQYLMEGPVYLTKLSLLLWVLSIRSRKCRLVSALMQCDNLR